MFRKTTAVVGNLGIQHGLVRSANAVLLYHGHPAVAAFPRAAEPPAKFFVRPAFGPHPLVGQCKHARTVRAWHILEKQTGKANLHDVPMQGGTLAQPTAICDCHRLDLWHESCHRLKRYHACHAKAATCCQRIYGPSPDAPLAAAASAKHPLVLRR